MPCCSHPRCPSSASSPREQSSSQHSRAAAFPTTSSSTIPTSRGFLWTPPPPGSSFVTALPRAPIPAAVTPHTAHRLFPFLLFFLFSAPKRALLCGGPGGSPLFPTARKNALCGHGPPRLLHEPQCKTGGEGGGEGIGKEVGEGCVVFFFFFSFFNKVIASSRDTWPGFPSRKIKKKGPKRGWGGGKGREALTVCIRGVFTRY